MEFKLPVSTILISWIGSKTKWKEQELLRIGSRALIMIRQDLLVLHKEMGIQGMEQNFRISSDGEWKGQNTNLNLEEQ